MQTHNAKPLIKGFVKNILMPKFLTKQTKGGGATMDSRYCYSVWMRHLKKWNSVKNSLPEKVIEYGPGATLGIGFAALLSGVSKLYAIDIIKYWNNEQNLRLFDELVELFNRRAQIPGAIEYERVRPLVDDLSFPVDMLPEEQLHVALNPERIAKIRHEIMNIETCDNVFIEFQILEHGSNVIEKNSVDLIISQAVLQHVSDLDETYSSMRDWLKPNGLMSHSIDFKCFGTSSYWNGHWCYSHKEWKIVSGDYYLVNRQPLSTHLTLQKNKGFKVLKKELEYKDNHLSKTQLFEQFKELSEEDLTTSGTYILSEKQ